MVKQLTIIHCVPSLHIGGINKSLIESLTELARGPQRHVVCVLGENLLLAPELNKLGVQFVSLGHRGARDTIRTLFRFRRLVVNKRADIIHNHQVLSRVFGGLVARSCGIPSIASLHSIGGRRPRKSLNLAMRIADMLLTTEFVAVSHAVAHAYSDLHPVLADHITVIHNGVCINDEYRLDAPPEFRRSLNIPDNAPVLLNVGRMVLEKDQMTLVSVMAEIVLTHPEAVLLIAGSGDQSELVQAAVDASGLGGSIQLLGRRADVPELLRLADLVVLSSLSEGFGMVAIEAMAAGRAIVGTNIPAMSEVVHDGKEGLLVGVRDVPAFATAIRELLNETDRRLDMASAGRARAVGSFSAAAAAAALERLYDALAGQTIDTQRT